MHYLHKRDVNGNYLKLQRFRFRTRRSRKEQVDVHYANTCQRSCRVFRFVTLINIVVQIFFTSLLMHTIACPSITTWAWALLPVQQSHSKNPSSNSQVLGFCELSCSYDGCVKRHSAKLNLISKRYIFSSKALYISLSSDTNNDEFHTSNAISLSARFLRNDNNVSNSDNLYIMNLKNQHNDYLRQNKLQDSFRCISEIFVFVEQAKSRCNEQQLLVWGHTVDCMLQAFTSQAFAPPYDGSNPYIRQRIYLGVDAIQLQLSLSLAQKGDVGILPSPYNTVQRSTLLLALKALTSLNEKHEPRVNSGCYNTATDEAFRVLQRLVTGVGVRTYQPSQEPVPDEIKNVTNDVSNSIEEYQFNRVLNSFSNAGRMDMVHRVLALQERGSNSPPLSRVSYSILLKGYGRQLRDIQNVESVLKHAIRNQIEPDTILLNSLIDAYVNCNEINKAKQVFEHMKNNDISTMTSTSRAEGVNKSILSNWFQKFPCPRPNRRTYNIILKGLANSGCLEEVFSLAQEMKTLRLWDTVTTNTIVHATIKVGNFGVAEELLTNFTATKWDTQKKHQHPNIEAYTELIDAYAKKNDLPNAIATLQLMRKRGVTPNEVTYNCLLGGFGRSRKVGQARAMLHFMNSTNVRVTTRSYNALISGLLQCKVTTDGSSAPDFSVESRGSELDDYVDEALKLLREMIHASVRPNDVTVSVLVDALGRCVPPRLNEASVLVEKLERQNFITRGSTKTATALVQSYGKAGDLIGAMAAFRQIRRPDTIAVNSFLDACSRCGRVEVMTRTFDLCFQNEKKKYLVPDVISYSIMIGVFLKKGTTLSVMQTLKMYEEMKRRNIQPDKALIDLILKEMIRFGNPTSAFDKVSAKLVTKVLSDAENLSWDDGQLESRKRAVRDRLPGFLKKDIIADVSYNSTVSLNDDLFERKGWNTVDSGFRLWGWGRHEIEEKKKKKRSHSNTETTTCKFLESHGWNDVNSGFRLF